MLAWSCYEREVVVASLVVMVVLPWFVLFVTMGRK